MTHLDKKTVTVAIVSALVGGIIGCAIGSHLGGYRGSYRGDMMMHRGMNDSYGRGSMMEGRGKYGQFNDGQGQARPTTGTTTSN